MSKLAHSNEWSMNWIELREYSEQRRLGQITLAEYLELNKTWWCKWRPTPKKYMDTSA